MFEIMEWKRTMPDYVLRLITYYTKMERLLAEKQIELEKNEDAEE